MSSIVSLASALVAKNMAEGQMDLGATLTKIANNSDNAVVGILDKLVQQGQQNDGVSAPGLGENLNIKA